MLDTSEFLVGDFGYPRPVQFTNIERTFCSSAENKSFLPFAKHPVEKLVSKHKLRRLIQLASTALVNFALMNLAVVLTFWNNQQRLIQTGGIEILRHNESVADVRLLDILAFPPIFCDIAIRLADLDCRKHHFEPLNQCLPHDAHERGIPCGKEFSLLFGNFKFARMVQLMTLLAKSYQIIRSVPARLAGFNVMGV